MQNGGAFASSFCIRVPSFAFFVRVEEGWNQSYRTKGAANAWKEPRTHARSRANAVGSSARSKRCNRLRRLRLKIDNGGPLTVSSAYFVRGSFNTQMPGETGHSPDAFRPKT